MIYTCSTSAPNQRQDTGCHIISALGTVLVCITILHLDIGLNKSNESHRAPAGQISKISALGAVMVCIIRVYNSLEGESMQLQSHSTVK